MITEGHHYGAQIGRAQGAVDAVIPLDRLQAEAAIRRAIHAVARPAGVRADVQLM
jgi:hypothetical protein